MDQRPRRDTDVPSFSERFFGNVSRLVVSLTWAVLLAVILFVAYLLNRFYG
jgi:flagellar biogenesis protein FliO